MISQLTINNFKAWRRADLKLGSVTGLFGTNSSGKSSLLQFLLLLKQTKNATDRGLVLDFGGHNQLVNLGGYKDAVHRHDITKSIQWDITWKLMDKISINDTEKKRTFVLAASDQISLKSEVHYQSGALVSDHLAYKFAGYEFSIKPKRNSTTEFQLTVENPPGSDFAFVRNRQRAWALPGPIKTHLFPDQAKTYYQNTEFLSLFETQYEELMNSIYYLGPLREHPQRQYSWTGTSPTGVGNRGERFVEAILAATAKGETRNVRKKTKKQPFQAIIAHWLKELGLIHEFKVEEIGEGANIYRAMVKKDLGGTDVLLTDVGFGVSQVLPALVLLYYVPEGSTIIMEQPEIHLHPSVQSGLADAILTISQSRNLQVIIESHSEHILRRFQRRIADESYKHEDLKLYFCSSSGGNSALTPLDVNIFGEITNWPKDFFGDEVTEISEMRRAVLQRKMKS